MNKQIKLFLTFLILFSVFIQWGTWDENSRLSLTKSIVENNSFDITGFHERTGDRVIRNGEYHPARVPGMSILATSAHSIVHSLSLTDEDNRELYYTEEAPGGAILKYPVNLKSETAYSIILILIFFAALPGALLVLMIYKILLLFTQDDNKAFWVSVVFGAGTLIFPYSTVFIANIVSALFLSIIFYILLKVRRDDISNWYLVVAGIIFGFSLYTTTYYTVLFLITVIVFLYKDVKKLLKFAVPSLFSIIPFLLYLNYTHNNPFLIDFLLRPDSEVWIMRNILTRDLFGRFISPLRILFGTYEGIFFYSPVLILSVIGFYYLYKEKGFLAKVLVLQISAAVFFFGFTQGTLDYAAFGYRYLVPILFLFSVPLLYFLENNSFSYKKTVVYVLVGISVFHMILGLNPWTDFGSPTEENINSIYEKETQLKLVANPIYGYYLPQFKKNGPSSKLFGNLLREDFPLDLRWENPRSLLFWGDIRNDHPITSNVLEILVPFAPFLIFILVLWRKDIRSYKNKHLQKFQDLPVVKISVILLSIVLIFTFFQPENPKLSDGIDAYSSEEAMAMDEASIILYSTGGMKSMDLEMKSETGSQEMEIYLNSEKINSREIDQQWKMSTNKLDLRTGRNEIRFDIQGNCSYENVVEHHTNKDCLMFKIRNFDLKN